MDNKKNDLPAMPFYFGDWRKAPEIRALDLDVRMIWFEMMGLMWESTERGYLTLNEKPVITPVISRMLGIDITTFERALKQMEEYNVFSRRNDGAIYCRKMVRDEEIRRNRSKAGKVGMRKRYSNYVITPDITTVITKPLTNTENEIENENNSSLGINMYNNLIRKIVEIFVEIKGDYHILNMGKELKAAETLLNYNHQQKPGLSEEDILKLFKNFFQACLMIKDDWIQNNLTLPFIVNNFERIKNELKNGYRKSKSGATDEQIRNLFAEVRSEMLG